jgi:hypothetical protein
MSSVRSRGSEAASKQAVSSVACVWDTPAAIAATLVVAILLGQGHRPDTSIRVRNDTDQSWYVSVVRTPKYPDNLWVVSVDPGANAFAVEWEGGRGVPVHVLDAQCHSVGTFHQGSSGIYVVDAVPGLTGQIKDGPGYEPRTELPGIHDSLKCGGFLDR